MYTARLTVRNLDDDLVRQLKIRAARNNRSAEAEHRAILEATRPREEGFWRRAEAFRAATRGRQTTDSTVLARRDRDRRAETDARLRHRR